MNTTKTIAALFDFDGVIMDTETQYTVFWDEQGRKYLNEEDFGRRIKGQTLLQIYEKYFADKPEAQLTGIVILVAFLQDIIIKAGMMIVLQKIHCIRSFMCVGCSLERSIR